MLLIDIPNSRYLISVEIQLLYQLYFSSDSNLNKYFNNCMRFTIFIGQKVKWYLRVLDYDDQIRKHITGILLSDAFRRIQLDSTILAQNC